MPLIKAKANGNSDFQIPGLIKTVAVNDDYFIGIDNNGTPYKIRKTDLLAGLSSSSGGNSGGNSGTAIALNFVSSGDTNGIFYYLGTNLGTTNWTNPILLGKINASMSSSFNSAYGNVTLLTNRTIDNGVATANTPSQWVKFEIIGKALTCNYYSIRGRNINSNEIYNWSLQASNDNESWTTLDTRTNVSLANSAWYSGSIVAQNIAYKFFRIISTGIDSGGANILAFSEIELYGLLS